ncbi:YheC/YheD family endospore coat-associated protein [Halalkalibacter okhensis]|uniref:ATP-grasp domain-containing protein n=1 Tax=Halalkalibacter okhensis TaxID=333138 RepID=A0A0B0IBF7_9BACI|nr:YheC/YheD family protein [Halalkalibacter okhensis]KHF39868.1 hypothetical protein LQ50_12430 [Halalkalibacter okhensis]
MDLLKPKKTQLNIGVYISNKVINNLYKNQKAKFSIKELVSANKRLNTNLFFFSRKDVDLRQKIINGIYYNYQSQKWERRKYSYPDVLYSRTREINNNRNSKLRKSFIKEGITFLNSRSAFDKWNVHKALLKDSRAIHHLPLTRLYNHPRDLKKMFIFSRSVYIKPRVGRLGHSIIHVKAVPRKGYEYKYFSKKTKKLVFRRVRTFRKLAIDIARILKGKKVLMQSAIDSIKIDDKIVDMRAEIQRTSNGELQVMDLFSRIGAKNSPITNLPSGAKFFRFDPFIRSYLKYSEHEATLLKQKIELFLKKMHESIEGIYGPLGETAIDFAIDSKQHLWFIECNSTSTKLAYSVAKSPKQIVSKAFLNPLEYCIYLYENSSNKMMRSM